MSDRHTVRSLAALAIVLAVAVSGCTDTARPKPFPSASPSPTNSASETPTPPTMPPEASGTSAKSAEAFVRHWVEVLNYAGDTGDVRALADISDSGCTSCQAVIVSIRKAYTKGGYYRGDGWSVRTLQPQPFQPKSRPIITAGIHIAPQLVLESSDAKPKQFNGGERSMIFRLRATDGDWRVLQLDQPS